jgi:hypothetical protein
LIVIVSCLVKQAPVIFAFEIGHTAGLQGMFTPPRHLIPLLVCPGARVCLIFRIYISYGFISLITVHYITLSFSSKVNGIQNLEFAFYKVFLRLVFKY